MRVVLFLLLLLAIARAQQHVASVVMMNWSRPGNVRDLVRWYGDMQCVGEVLVMALKPDAQLDIDHPKARIVVDYQLNGIHGLNSRFMGCLMTRHPWVFVVDDDLRAPETTLQAMLQAKAERPRRVYSLWGRDYAEHAPQYTLDDSRRGHTARVALTKFMLTDHSFCQAHFRWAPRFEDAQRKGGAKPYWNGEDILHSLLSTKITGNRPFIVDAPVEELPDEDRLGVSWWDRHVEFREAFLQNVLTQLELY